MPSTPAEDAPLPAKPEEFQTGAERWVSAAMRGLMPSGHPLYAQITREPLHDLPSQVATAGQDPVLSSRPLNETADAAGSSLSYREIGASYNWIVDVNEALSFDVDSFIGSLALAADSFASQIERGVVEHISDFTEATGNVVSVRGPDFADAILDSLEQMVFSFTDAGEPNLTTIVLTPDMLSTLQNVQFSPAQQCRDGRQLLGSGAAELGDGRL